MRFSLSWSTSSCKLDTESLAVFFITRPYLWSRNCNLLVGGMDFAYKSHHVTVILQLVCTSRCFAEKGLFFCKKTHHHHSSVTLAQYPLSQFYCHGFEASPWSLKSCKGSFCYVVQKKKIWSQLAFHLRSMQNRWQQAQYNWYGRYGRRFGLGSGMRA